MAVTPMRVLHVGSQYTVGGEWRTSPLYTRIRPGDRIKFHFASVAINEPTRLKEASHGKKPVSVLVPNYEVDSGAEMMGSKPLGARPIEAPPSSHPRFWFPAFAHLGHTWERNIFRVMMSESDRSKDIIYFIQVIECQNMTWGKSGDLSKHMKAFQKSRWSGSKIHLDNFVSSLAGELWSTVPEDDHLPMPELERGKRWRAWADLAVKLMWRDFEEADSIARRDGSVRPMATLLRLVREKEVKLSEVDYSSELKRHEEARGFSAGRTWVGDPIEVLV